MKNQIVSIRRAIISVSDKSGLEELGRALIAKKVEILSSGGTAKFLKEKGIAVQEVSDFTGAPEMLEGRLKTLHPKIHGGILAIRSNPTHLKQLDGQGYVPIDLVVVNLYPFEETATKPATSFGDAVEQIDIGGPTLLRSAAKNFPFVAVLTDPGQYESFLEEFQSHDGGTPLEYRRALARQVFERTSSYDSAIATYFQGESDTPAKLYPLGLEEKWSLRYGENPHQNAGFYLPPLARRTTVLEKVLQGKALSYNNLMDVHGALDLICEFEGETAVAILKHTNPCGVGTSQTSLQEAYQRALQCDPVSAFGGIVVFSGPVDEATAKACVQTFTEIVIAPKYEDGARKVFAKKKNLRLLEVDFAAAKKALGGFDIRRAVDGYLLQNRDRSMENLKEANVVTKRPPSDTELRAMSFAWKVAKHVKSNSIVLANDHETVGVGAGQMSRVDSSRFAALKAQPEKLKGAVLASDAFFPFRDSIDDVAKHGITAIVEPGGSIRDEEVIAAADEHGIAMVFTGVRHFRH